MSRTLHSKSKAKNKMQTGYTQAKIQTLDLEGIRTAYRRVDVSEGTPILFLNHRAANMDGADPKVIDGLAAHFPVITFDYQGISVARVAKLPSRWRRWHVIPLPSYVA